MANPLTALSTRAAGKSIPWAKMYVAGRWVLARGHAAYTGLSDKERTQLAAIVRKSKGRPANVTKAEREQLGALVRKAAGAARGR